MGCNRRYNMIGIKEQLKFPDWSWNNISGSNFKNSIVRYLRHPFSDSVSMFGSLAGSSKWFGGVLAPNGCIYGIPSDSTTVLKINPSNDSVSIFGSLAGSLKWVNGVLAPNGCIYGLPYHSTSILKINDTGYILDRNFCLSRFVNKF